MIIAGRGLASASVAISPSPFRGVLPVPIAALRASSPVLRNPANRNRAVALTYEQFLDTALPSTDCQLIAADCGRPSGP